MPRAFRRAIKAAKLLTDHTRHTFASQLLQNGVILAHVQRMLGHGPEVDCLALRQVLPVENPGAVDSL